MFVYKNFFSNTQSLISQKYLAQLHGYLMKNVSHKKMFVIFLEIDRYFIKLLTN